MKRPDSAFFLKLLTKAYYNIYIYVVNAHDFRELNEVYLCNT